ncbi:ribosomal L7/L12 family protein [Streptacidiphilus fuscans]|uniref:Ribosomal protein L7/L12 C-terminal domain-containing protein n=1 Tax=Streptacidiphilus fuscans TaxID=2789292 RepID=A0A931FIF0_9ACTN|nr:hypothetical protein [Streptacidiphilus fuscans]MBF9071719.1 hypothetical protein [Streptacidiphilus fuscans]
MDLEKTDRPSVEQRLETIEQKLDVLLAHLGIDAEGNRVGFGGDPRLVDVEDAVRAGKLIQAIKVYREQTGAGLREAKAAVDGIAAELRRREGR